VLSSVVAAKLERLQKLVERREGWRAELDGVRQLHKLVLEAERLLSGEALRALDLVITNATVAQHFDKWCERLRSVASTQELSADEQRCLEHFLHVTDNMRPHLICCYDLEMLPRTNNDMEGFIRSIKTRYRRISGRKNWNRYLLRYGRRVAYYEAQRAKPAGEDDLSARVGAVPHALWRQARAEQQACQEEQLKQYRFRHRRQQFLADLEARWAGTTRRSGLLP
jgi:hypothetical protein